MTEQKKLQTLLEPHDIYRAQGAVQLLREILGLENFLTQYEKDLKAGKVREMNASATAPQMAGRTQ